MINLNRTIKYENDNNYRDALLSLYDLDDYDEETISKINDNLIETLKHSNEIVVLLNRLSGKFLLREDLSLGLVLLLSFDYLHLAYPVIKEYCISQTIQQEKYEELKKLIN